MCMCVCVCVRERERDEGRGGEGGWRRQREVGAAFQVGRSHRQ